MRVFASLQRLRGELQPGSARELALERCAWLDLGRDAPIAGGPRQPPLAKQRRHLARLVASQKRHRLLGTPFAKKRIGTHQDCVGELARLGENRCAGRKNSSHARDRFERRDPFQLATRGELGGRLKRCFERRAVGHAHRRRRSQQRASRKSSRRIDDRSFGIHLLQMFQHAGQVAVSPEKHGLAKVSLIGDRIVIIGIHHPCKGVPAPGHCDREQGGQACASPQHYRTQARVGIDACGFEPRDERSISRKLSLSRSGSITIG